MPLYIFYHHPDLWTTSDKKQLAQGITKAHCDTTGAPPFFVNVLFRPTGEDDFYIAGESDKSLVRMIGQIRGGRDHKHKQLLLDRIDDAIKKACWDKGCYWEISVHEFDSEMLRMNGHRMPDVDTDEETKWKKNGHAWVDKQFPTRVANFEARIPNSKTRRKSQVARNISPQIRLRIIFQYTIVNSLNTFPFMFNALLVMS